jgi:uncharacterized protein
MKVAIVKSAVLAASILAPLLLVTAASGETPAVAASTETETATVEDEHGTLNPQELTADFFIRQAGRKAFDPHMCMYGYFVAKSGNHPGARKIFDRCASEGVLGAMPWAAWEAENGFDKPSDPVKAAEWDRRAAEAGYSVGELNYGLDLLRGHGVAFDESLGRDLIDRAARQGDTTARRLVENGYDPESVTPDPDKERYRKKMY